MTLLSIISSIAIGSIIGIVYGHFFMHQKRKILMMHEHDNAVPTLKKTMMRNILSMVRLAILAIVWLFILRWESIQFILVVPCFIITFWLILLKQKARLNERH
jgi:dipeptide/tripeptide permease